MIILNMAATGFFCVFYFDMTTPPVAALIVCLCECVCVRRKNSLGWIQKAFALKQQPETSFSIKAGKKL